jgi:hypothetical protein
VFQKNNSRAEKPATFPPNLKGDNPDFTKLNFFEKIFAATFKLYLLVFLK